MEDFLARVNALNLNVDALERVDLYDSANAEIVSSIPNAEGKKNSLIIYAALVSNDGYITPESAEEGLIIFGDELRKVSMETPGKHPNIDFLEEISKSGKKRRVDVARRESSKPIPDYLSEAMKKVAEENGTPFHIYDERAIRAKVRELAGVFSWIDFKECFVVKALPNPVVLQFLKEEGCGADCSSAPELYLSNLVGISGEDIMFTSNDTPSKEYDSANELGAVINLDDITHISEIERLVKEGKTPAIGCLRYNPGPLRSGNVIMGLPEEAKYGMTKEQLLEGYKKLKELGISRFGVHTMIVSNELNPNYFVETARMLFKLVKEIKDKLGIKLEFVNLGGGIGTPYKPEQIEVDLKIIGEGVKKSYEELIVKNDLQPLKIYMENGRSITGPYGYLVTKVIHKKDTYRNYIGVDSCMADLMRPGMYGAFHHMTVLGKEDAPKDVVYDVVGSLCENNDKFAVNRKLPKIETGDLIAIHNTGAHGISMGFNYNAKLRPAEFLVRKDGSILKIRRAETREDYFATLKFPGATIDMK